jgi:glycosyltransferase involved in cell wall biosynthesis
MRILRVAQHLYPDTKGGGQYHVYAMSRDQAAMGHDVTVLTTRNDSSLPRVEETHGYTVLRVDPGISVLGNDISPAVARCLWDVDGDVYDVIHAHSHLYFSTNLTSLKRRFGDVPLAITNHGLYSQSAPERIFRWYLRTLGRWTFNQADVVFCYTDVDKERVRDLGVSSRIEVVANGIDTERFTPEGPGSELIDAEGPVVLFVGRFTDGKRPWLAVEAFDGVLNEYPDAELYLCGKGGLRDDLEAQVTELGIEESVTLLGHVTYDEMPKVYRNGDVLLLPSRAEGVPRTVLEAMVSRLKIVMTDLDQVSSIVEEHVETVKSGDLYAYTEAILHCIAGSDQTGEIIPREVSQHKWEDTVQRTTDVLHELYSDSEV